MKFEGNLNFTEVISRHFAGAFVAVLGGFLGHYVAPIFYVLVPIAPVLILTAILGWCPLFDLLNVNHASKSH